MSNPNDLLQSPEAGGQCGALLRAYDAATIARGDSPSSEAGFRTLLDAILRSPTAMLLMWGERGLIFYNDAYTAIAGARHPTAFGQPATEVWPEIAQFNFAAPGSANTGGPPHAQRSRLKRDGADAWYTIDYSAVPDAQGRAAGTLAVAAVTHAPAQETGDALRRTQKMATVGQLTRGVAHEFNNMLQSIAGSMELVRKLVSMNRAAETEKFTTTGLAATRRAATLIQHLLDFARPRPFAPEILDANAVIASMEELLRGSQASSIKIEFALAATLWPTKCDANHLENAILNLVIDARDAIPDGGVITIGTSNVDADAALAADDIAPAQYVCIEVTAKKAAPHAADAAAAGQPPRDSAGFSLSVVCDFAHECAGHVRSDGAGGRRLYLLRQQN